MHIHRKPCIPNCLLCASEVQDDCQIHADGQLDAADSPAQLHMLSKNQVKAHLVAALIIHKRGLFPWWDLKPSSKCHEASCKVGCVAVHGQSHARLIICWALCQVVDLWEEYI